MRFLGPWRWQESLADPASPSGSVAAHIPHKTTASWPGVSCWPETLPERLATWKGDRASPWYTDRACSLVKNHSLFGCVSLFKRFLLHLQHCRRRIFEGTVRRQYVFPVCQGRLMVLAKPDIVRTGHFQLCVQRRDAICVSRFKGGPNWEYGIWGEVMRPEDARLHPALGVDHRQIIWARHQALR